MLQLLEFSFSGVNLIPTILMLFVLLYWLIVIVGVVDIDTIDFDMDMDIDADAEIDGDLDIGGISSVLAFFNIGQMPLMIFVTFFTIPLWVLTLLVNDHFGIGSWLIGGGVLIGVAFLCLFIAKFLTTPIARFYQKVKENTEAVKNIIGKVCTAKLPVSHDVTGQAEIKVKGTSVLINVRTREGFNVPKGATALVIDSDKSENLYYVEPYNL